MNETLLDGRYELLEAIGTGGEARVFRARDTTTGQEVAARLALKPGTYTAPDQLPELHAGWAQVLAWGNDPHQGAYQIFELLKGPTLHQLIKFGPLDSPNWRRFVDQSLDAVGALHEVGWVHGDLNADNFVHAGPSASGWKLLELPFLRFTPPADRTALFGSIHTLAPEQLNGKPADALSDLYALGCLYYYAACGEFPHPGANNQDIAIARLRFAPEPLEAKAPRLPAAWSNWVMTLLAFAPQNRFPSAAAARQLLGIA